VALYGRAMLLNRPLSLYKNPLDLLRYPAIPVERCRRSRRFNAPGSANLRKVKLALAALSFIAVPLLYPSFASAATTCSPGAPVLDDFNGSALNTALWTAAAPAGGSVSVSNGHALLSVPGGSNHDPLAGGDNSVRIMQPISNSNFDVAAKFDSPVNSAYEGQGIMVQQDSGTYIRFEVYSDGWSNYVSAGNVAAGQETQQINVGVSNPGPSFWLQVQRSGNTWTLSTSTDGVTYTTAGSFTLAFTASEIGLYAWNYNDTPSSAAALTASIDYFHNLSAPQPAVAVAPVFNPGSETFSGTQQVSLSDSTPGATIHYTLDGSTPTASSPAYSSPISIAKTTTIKAIATASGYSASGVSSATYTQQQATQQAAAAPTFNPGGKTFSGTQQVSLSDSTPGATIHYTLNGSTPTASSSVYSSPLSITTSTTIKAIATASGYAASAVSNATYTQQAASAPTLNPAGGASFSSTLSVSISDATSGAAIHYTTDGSTPTVNSPLYTGAFTISATTTVKAIAQSAGYAVSAVSSATYSLQVSSSHDVTYSTEDVVFPSGGPAFFDVTQAPYNCDNTGVQDVTTCLQNVIYDASNVFRPVIYLPQGTYLISAPLILSHRPPSNPAVVTANVSGGQITGFNVINGGSGYIGQYDSVGACNQNCAGLYITDPTGSGAKMLAAMLDGNGSVTGIQTYGNGTIGQGYSNNPSVQVINYGSQATLLGQNQSKTIIRLKNNSPAYSNESCVAGVDTGLALPKCNRMILWGGGIAQAEACDESQYQNNIANLTLDAGSGNPGTVALDWCGSNVSYVKNMTIKSEDGRGRAGLFTGTNDGYGGSGPDIIKNVKILGFDFGIVTTSGSVEVGNTYEYIDLENQNIAGVVNSGYSNWFHAVSATESVPVFVNCASGGTGSDNNLMQCANVPNNVREGSLTIVDGNFTGTGAASSKSAIEMQNDYPGGGLLYARNIVTNGYQSALALGPSNTPTTGSAITEYAYPSVIAPFGTSNASVNIGKCTGGVACEPNQPHFVDNNLSDIFDVSSLGGNCTPYNDNNATACIQQAFNSGKPVIYFPTGHWTVDGPLTIPSTVRKIYSIGGAGIDCGAGFGGGDFITVANSGQPFVEWQNMWLGGGCQSGGNINITGSTPFVLTDVEMGWGSLTNSGGGTGDVYWEDSAMTGLTLSLGTNQHLWARQLDLESGYNLHLSLTGGQSWIFGFKSEGPGQLLQANGGTVEILGGFHTENPANAGNTAYVTNNTTFSLAGDVSEGYGFGQYVSETRGSNTQTTGMNGNWNAGNTAIGLYSGH
jgi:regulation of enolase protein 1 (concanavalin A-like superfamily)